MILKMPTRFGGKAMGFVWYQHANICIAYPSAKLKLAGRPVCAINFNLHFPKNILRFTYHLHCAISGPG
jgi:hypothetical protein